MRVKSAPIFVVLGLGALLGWFGPDLTERDSAAVSVAGTQSEERLAALQRDQWLAGEVVLSRAADGHFYAEVTAESGSALMLVDTGASKIALTAEDADAMGVAWSEDDLRPVARGANGTVFGVPVRLDRVSVGDLEAEGVEAVVVPEGLDISLLGQSFLSQVGRIEVSGDEMALGG